MKAASGIHNTTTRKPVNPLYAPYVMHMIRVVLVGTVEV